MGAGLEKSMLQKAHHQSKGKVIPAFAGMTLRLLSYSPEATFSGTFS